MDQWWDRIFMCVMCCVEIIGTRRAIKMPDFLFLYVGSLIDITSLKI